MAPPIKVFRVTHSSRCQPISRLFPHDVSTWLTNPGTEAPFRTNSHAFALGPKGAGVRMPMSAMARSGD